MLSLSWTWSALVVFLATAAAAAAADEDYSQPKGLRKRVNVQHRALRQTIFCRCVADYENFYGGKRKLQPSKYYHYETANDATVKDVQPVIGGGKYYHADYTPKSDVTLGKDGYFIVDGITVLPLSNEACIVSQTNAALRAFLEIFYSPRGDHSASSFWARFHKRRALTSVNHDQADAVEEDKRLFGGEETDTVDQRDLRRGYNWDERRKRAFQDLRRKRPIQPTRTNNAIFNTDLSGGTSTPAPSAPYKQYPTPAIPRVFPCPPNPPASPPSATPAPTYKTVQSHAPTKTMVTGSDAPSLAPTRAAPSKSPKPTASSKPSQSPSISAKPSVSAKPSSTAQCSAHRACVVAGLTGKCCPTNQGVNLDCCGTHIVFTPSARPSDMPSLAPSSAPKTKK